MYGLDLANALDFSWKSDLEPEEEQRIAEIIAASQTGPRLGEAGFERGLGTSGE
jgi:hypothetical protein